MINGIEDKCVDRSFIFSIFNGKPDGGNLVKGFWVTLLWGNLSIKNLAMAVADEVDSLVERSPLAPILLFNEADGILGISSTAFSSPPRTSRRTSTRPSSAASYDLSGGQIEYCRTERLCHRAERRIGFYV